MVFVLVWRDLVAQMTAIKTAADSGDGAQQENCMGQGNFSLLFQALNMLLFNKQNLLLYWKSFRQHVQHIMAHILWTA